MADRTLSALIIGPSGTGKSWLGSTTPPPRLIIDLEGRAKYTPAGRGATEWDGTSDPMKLPKSKTRTYILRTTDLADVAMARQWLRSGKHPFVSVTLDSLMEAQMRAQSDIRPGVQALRPQDWGMLLRSMEDVVRDIRDLTMDPNSGVKCVVAIAGATLDQAAGFIRPLMSGQITKRVPYWMDLVGYYEKVRLEDGTVQRQLWIDQRPENDLEVKDGTHDIISAFGGCIVTPTFEAMYNALLPEPE